MAGLLERYAALQKRITKQQKTAAEAKARYDVTMQTLETEFGVTSLKDASRLLKKLEKSAEDAAAAAERALTEFEETYHDLLK